MSAALAEVYRPTATGPKARRGTEAPPYARATALRLVMLTGAMPNIMGRFFGTIKAACELAGLLSCSPPATTYGLGSGMPSDAVAVGKGFEPLRDMTPCPFDERELSTTQPTYPPDAYSKTGGLSLGSLVFNILCHHA